MSQVQPTGGIVYCHDGYLVNSNIFSFKQDIHELYVEGSVLVKTNGSTGTLRTDTSGRFQTRDFASETVNVGPNLYPTGSYGNFQIQTTGSVLAARATNALGQTGPEYQLAPTVLNPTTFQGSIGATASIGTATSPGTLLTSVTLTPTVLGYSWMMTNVELANPSNTDTVVSVYLVIDGTTGTPTSFTLTKKVGSAPTQANVSVNQRTTIKNPPGVLVTGSVYAYQTVAGAAYMSHMDTFAMTNLG